MRFDTVIRNATVVTATDTYRADVGITGDRVSAIAAQLPTENSGRVTDATGLLLIPGGIDVHTHLDMPFDDTTIFKAMRQAAEHNCLICMHAENGGAIDVLVQRALAEGKRAPKYHALTRPTTAEAEATSRSIALAEMAGAPVYIVHLSCND